VFVVVRHGVPPRSPSFSTPLFCAATVGVGVSKLCRHEEACPAGLAQREVGSVKKRYPCWQGTPLALLFTHDLSSIQSYLHTQDFRGASRHKSQLLRATEASQLGTSSGLQQYPQPWDRVVPW